MEMFCVHPTELTQNNKLNPENFNSIGQILLKIFFLKGKNNLFWENELWTYGNRNCQNKTPLPEDLNSGKNQTSIFCQNFKRRLFHASVPVFQSQ